MTTPRPAATDKQVNFARIILKQEATLKADLGHLDVMTPEQRESRIQTAAADKWRMSDEISRAKRNITALKAEAATKRAEADKPAVNIPVEGPHGQIIDPPAPFKVGDRVVYTRREKNELGTITAVEARQGDLPVYEVELDTHLATVTEFVTTLGRDLKRAPVTRSVRARRLGATPVHPTSRLLGARVRDDETMNDPKNRTFVLDDGVYMVRGDFTRVTTSKSSGYQYATVWNVDTREFDHVPGGIRNVRKFGRVCTLAEIEGFASQHKVCLVCGRKIKTEESVKRGIGPVCAKKVKARMEAAAT